MCSTRYFVGYSMWYSVRYSKYFIGIRLCLKVYDKYSRGSRVFNKA